MIDVRIVCSHDAVKLAEMLTRLLEAEEHRVRLTYGRQALLELEEAREARDAVLLIWSPDARSQTYMLEWVRNIDPVRLVEISRGASDFHPIKRLAAVIDFTNWRGQRGARAWKALNERLSAIARHLAPPAPVPAKALMAMGVASMAAVAGAVMVRVNMPVELAATPASLEEIAATDPASGVGGPLNAIEPASLDDEAIRVRHYPNLASIDTESDPLMALVEYQELELREPTLREQFDGAINTLFGRNDNPSE